MGPRHRATLPGQESPVDRGVHRGRHQPGIAITNRLHHLGRGVRITERRQLMRDRPELPVLSGLALVQIFPEQAQDCPNLLDALASLVNRFRAASNLLTANFLERFVKFACDHTRQLPGDCPPPLELVRHVTSSWPDPGIRHGWTGRSIVYVIKRWAIAHGDDGR